MKYKKIFKFIEENQSFGLGFFFGMSLCYIFDGYFFTGIVGLILSSALILNRFYNITKK